MQPGAQCIINIMKENSPLKKNNTCGQFWVGAGALKNKQTNETVCNYSMWRCWLDVANQILTCMYLKHNVWPLSECFLAPAVPKSRTVENMSMQLYIYTCMHCMDLSILAEAKLCSKWHLNNVTPSHHAASFAKFVVKLNKEKQLNNWGQFLPLTWTRFLEQLPCLYYY